MKKIVDGVSKMLQSRINYWAEFVIDIPLATVLIYQGLHHKGHDLIGAFLIILLGLFIFSFMEYFVHRRLFHGSIQFVARAHQAHHRNPLGYDALPFFLPALMLLSIAAICVLLMPRDIAFLLTGTVGLGYAVYGLSHFTIHHHRFHQVLARNWAANHHIHHYHADTNFGVTTPLWDMFLGTRYVRPSS